MHVDGLVGRRAYSKPLYFLCAVISVAVESNQVNFLKMQGTVLSSKGYETFK